MAAVESGLHLPQSEADRDVLACARSLSKAGALLFAELAARMSAIGLLPTDVAIDARTEGGALNLSASWITTRPVEVVFTAQISLTEVENNGARQ